MLLSAWITLKCKWCFQPIACPSYLARLSRVKCPTGDIEVVSGVAFTTGDPGKYALVLGTGKSANSGSYWIVELGEIPPGEKSYPWSIVSTPYETSLFILARNVREFRDKYEQFVLDRAEKLGFKYFFNKPIPTYQEDDCNYYEPPSSVTPCRKACYSNFRKY